MANFENVPVQLTGFEMENSTMLWSVFISEVGQNVKVCKRCQCTEQPLSLPHRSGVDRFHDVVIVEL